jgi:hypothetical protein
MSDKKFNSPCQGKSAKPSPTSNTLSRRSDRINPTPTSNQIMGRKSNTHKRTKNHQRSARRGKKSSKRCVEYSCIPRKGGRWGTTPGPQLSRVPTGKPNGENNGSLQPIFRLHGNTGRVRMSDCVRGIEPCECKGKGHRFRRVGLLGCFSLVKMRRERKE